VLFRSMVPPIWLVNDPQPRYPEELNLIAKPLTDWLKYAIRTKAQHPACKLPNRPRQKALI